MLPDGRYIAGFFDGEGCVHITEAGSYKSGKPHLTVKVQIANTNTEILRDIQQVVGGTVSTSLSAIQKASNRQYPCYKLSLTAHTDVKKFIEVVGPFVRVKARQVESLRRYAETMRGYGNRLSDEDWSIRERTRQELSAYNQNHREVAA